MAATLADLPDAALAHILRLLPTRGILSFSCACQALRRVACGEIADVIALLCSARSSYVTGSAGGVDGGTVPVII